MSLGGGSIKSRSESEKEGCPRSKSPMSLKWVSLLNLSSGL